MDSNSNHNASSSVNGDINEEINIEMSDKSLTDNVTIETINDSKPSDESESSAISTEATPQTIDLLTKQRAEITELLTIDNLAAKEGDKVYIIPKIWYDSYFDPNINDPRQIRPIDIHSIVRNYEHFLLKDYETHPYINIPESVFLKFVEWYGMTRNSKPLCTFLIWNPETGNLVTEYNKLFFRIQYLLSPDSRSMSQTSSMSRKINNINYFTVSVIDTLKDSMTKIVDFFFDVESNLDIENTKVKVWYVNNNTNDNNTNVTDLPSSYIIDEIQFLSFPNRKRITSSLFDKTLRDSKITSGNFVIEIKQSQKNYHWTSNFLKYNQLVPGTGTVGLQNLGNTCYMNSALQCLSHVPQLRDYFLYNGFEKEINTVNPLGYQGYIANAFSGLIQNLFGERMGSNAISTSIAPSHFKSTVGHFNSMFSGYLQQDSQEFLAFILDSLHEDLNRVVDKPYVEKPSLSKTDNVDDFETIKKLANDTWLKHLQRNDSVITDLFVGLYKSTLECPECNNVSVTFDPYNDLTLPLPIESIWRSKVRIFPQNSPPCVLEVELSKKATYQDLKEYVAKKAEMDVNNVFGCEIFSHQFYNNFESDSSNSKFLSLQELISESDLIAFYEIQAAKEDIIIPVLNTFIEEGFSNSRLFGIPFFISVSTQELSNPLILREKLENAYKYLSGGYINFKSQNIEYKEDVSIDDFFFLKAKYPNTDFKQYTEYLKHAVLKSNTQEVEMDDTNPSPSKFFDIKILDDINEFMISKSRNDGGNLSPVFWTPPAHTNFKNAKNITDFLDPVLSDIYNYQYLTIDNSEDGKNSEMDIDQDNIVQQSDIEESEKMEELTTNSVTNGAVSRSGHSTDSASLSSSFDPFNAIVCEWNSNSLEETFSSDKIINWERPAVLENKELEDIREARAGLSKAMVDITLDDCLKLFSRKEVLGVNDLWYCPNCKEHRQASKRIQIWNTPDILLIHLKRFESQQSFADKITDVVKFPINNLDLADHVVDKEDPRGTAYDLFAVDNHYGGLGGGHYTAYVKNFIDDRWYYFDDSRVTETVPENSISEAAYLLFYIRRYDNDENCEGTSNHYGSEKLQEIISESRKQHSELINSLITVQEELYETNKTDIEDMTNNEDDAKDIESDTDDNGNNDSQEEHEDEKSINSGMDSESNNESSTKEVDDVEENKGSIDEKNESGNYPQETLAEGNNHSAISKIGYENDEIDSARKKMRLIENVCNTNESGTELNLVLTN